MNAALLVDFGSTWTKVRVVDLDEARVVATAQRPSTVSTDVNVGLDAALADLTAQIGALPTFRYRLGASSAAGGLRMVTIGLVRELTAEAARQAALGAGARLVGSYAYRLTAADVHDIETTAPDVVLLTGGTDGGNRDVVVYNARALGESTVEAPIIVACNRDATDEIRQVLAASGKSARFAANVMPEFNVLATEAAREAIRDIFIARIVHSKGIDRAGSRLDAVLMPTPAAVLEGARLLAQGPSGNDGLGPLVVVDPGGATTDVHSIASGEAAEPGVVSIGLPEPFAKRTVEGDLGVRHNVASIVEATSLDALAHDAGLSPARARTKLDRMTTDTASLPASDEDVALDRALGRAAIRIAVRRHAGSRELVYTAHGPVQVQRGKDLSDVRRIIGTGGVVVASADPAAMLAPALADAAERDSLRPRAAALAVDRDYALFASGLLAQVEPVTAYRLASTGLVELTRDHHGQHAAA